MGGGHFTKETIVLLKWSKTRNELLYSSMIIINVKANGRRFLFRQEDDDGDDEKEDEEEER